MGIERKQALPKQVITFDAACAAVEQLLHGTAREEIVDDVSQSRDLRQALLRLRDRMRSNVWRLGANQIDLERIVKRYDGHTRRDGFHVLHDWDGTADVVNKDAIPVDVLHYVIGKRGGEPASRVVLAMLLDYHFLHILALLSLRIWDDGDADGHLSRLNRLLGDLQGGNGSGQRFVANAETLLLIATSHFEAVERGYGTLLARVQALNRSHRVNIALGHAASIGSHLRFGFEATYRRDTVAMREDNVADYPWLCFSLTTMMTEYIRMQSEGTQGPERERVVEAMLNGVSADPRAFVGTAPPSLSACEAERAGFRDGFHRYRRDLLEEFEGQRPSDRTYSPLSFFFNFSHNILKGTVIDALLRGEAWPLTFNDLLTGVPRAEPAAAAKETLATTLMGYARANPDRIHGRLMPVIVYDPRTGRQAFAAAMRKLRE